MLFFFSFSILSDRRSDSSVWLGWGGVEWSGVEYLMNNFSLFFMIKEEHTIL